MSHFQNNSVHFCSFLFSSTPSPQNCEYFLDAHTHSYCAPEFSKPQQNLLQAKFFPNF